MVGTRRVNKERKREGKLGFMREPVREKVKLHRQYSNGYKKRRKEIENYGLICEVFSH